MTNRPFQESEENWPKVPYVSEEAPPASIFSMLIHILHLCLKKTDGSFLMASCILINNFQIVIQQISSYFLKNLNDGLTLLPFE